ncbi:hypothetical protein [Streptomyces longispororuber]|uniref:hypothetical protein n=1 Tax=Streptomyces longispororuber TaxID=68230 RepID=UPI0036F90392
MNTQTGKPEELTRAVVVLSVTEATTTHFPVAVEVPIEVATEGPEALAAYIALSDDVQLFELPAEESTAFFMTVSRGDVEDVMPPL